MFTFNHNEILYEKVIREFRCNCLWYQVTDRYFEQKAFQEALLFYIFNLCELNPTNKVPLIVNDITKSFLFKEPDQRLGVYKPIRYIILPVLFRDHRVVERKKQKKLSFLANELSNAGQHTQGHIVRTIVKPYIRDLNRKWAKMTALDKLKTVPPTSAWYVQ